jgi:hypothetical protein
VKIEILSRTWGICIGLAISIGSFKDRRLSVRFKQASFHAPTKIRDACSAWRRAPGSPWQRHSRRIEVSKSRVTPSFPHFQTSSGARYISPTSREEALDLPVGDEQIVNTAAINFLNTLFIHDSLLADWTLQRKQFKFKSDFVKFEARTDGYFNLHGQERSAAGIEVKPRVRRQEHVFRIEMQESAQMALWIYQEPNSHWAPQTGGNKYQEALSRKLVAILLTACC